MDFFNWIEKVKEKPEAARKRLAVFFAFFITLAVALVWLTIFLAGDKSGKSPANYRTPFSVIKDAITNGK